MKPKDERKFEAVISATCRLAAERGLLGLTLSQIAKAANIGTSTLYVYFSDKEMLASGIDSGDALYYLGERPYSAQYYSGGRAIQAEAFPDEQRFYLVTRRTFKDARLSQHCELRSQNEERALYFCRLDPPA